MYCLAIVPIMYILIFFLYSEDLENKTFLQSANYFKCRTHALGPRLYSDPYWDLDQTN